MVSFDSSIARAEHFANAIRWYSEQLQSNKKFQSSFHRVLTAVNTASNYSLNTESKQVHFVAVGKSAGVGSLAVSMLNSVGIRACFLHPTEAFHGDFGAVKIHDVVICISNFGRTREILEAIPHLKDRQCEIFAVTSRTDSPLANACDDVLPLPQVKEFCPLDQAPITSTVTTLALCQLLVGASMESRGLELENYARNHPGGAIGKRIFVRVEDIMTKGANLPRVSATETFEGCVSAMTNFAKAGLVVVENEKLVGLIAERDLRVAMQKYGASVFSKSATDLMNASPTVVSVGTLASAALKIMEERPRALNILPVVDSEHRAVGLLHIHDLISHGISK